MQRTKYLFLFCFVFVFVFVCFCFCFVFVAYLASTIAQPLSAEAWRCTWSMSKVPVMSRAVLSAGIVADTSCHSVCCALVMRFQSPLPRSMPLVLPRCVLSWSISALSSALSLTAAAAEIADLMMLCPCFLAPELLLGAAGAMTAATATAAGATPPSLLTTACCSAVRLRQRKPASAKPLNLYFLAAAMAAVRLGWTVNKSSPSPLEMISSMRILVLSEYSRTEWTSTVPIAASTAARTSAVSLSVIKLWKCGKAWTPFAGAATAMAGAVLTRAANMGAAAARISSTVASAPVVSKCDSTSAAIAFT